jgi:hypothetical protein
MKTKLWVAVYDLHHPKYDKPTWNCVLDFISKNKLDGFIFGGDENDNEEISHHNADKPIFHAVGSYKRNTDNFEKEILTPLEKLLPKNCIKVIITGNHTRFEQDFIEKHPQLQGIIERFDALQLRERGWNIIPLGHAFKLGKLSVIHGEVLTGYGAQVGAYPARKAVDIYAGNVLAGHTHNPQQHTRVSPVEHKNKWQGTIAPIAGATNPGYLRSRPSAWVNGFVIIETFPDGNFNLYSVNVINGRCSYGGVVYGRRK